MRTEIFHDFLHSDSRNADGEHQGSECYMQKISHGNTTVYVTYITNFRM